MSVSHSAFVALGANIGDPVSTLRNALEALTKIEGARRVAASSLYRTAPVGLINQPDFINAVARLETTLPAPALLAALFRIEADFGRIRGDRNGPRSLDLDLLLYDDLVVDTPELTLPHPRLHLRAFVLVPLAEIAPDLAIPGRGTLAAWLPAVANQTIERMP
jgi:2-amino-4-hydroxy-6-hydroxymethyldihydropteridine diphosphokinase